MIETVSNRLVKQFNLGSVDISA